MPGVMDGVNRLTQLAGHNRMELLMFHLGDKQRFGINVFKVQEVIHCPALTRIPKAHPVIRGIADIRGKTMSVVDLGMVVGKAPIDNPEDGFIIVTEYNTSVQGYLVSAVDRIINMNWEEILPPPKGMSTACYLTAVTRVDEKFVGIIDVEKILADLTNTSTSISESMAESGKKLKREDMFILVSDDSAVARKQISRPLEQMNIDYVMTKNGREALEMLQDWAQNDPHKLTNLMMVISDIEMPEMDGYTLTSNIRKDNQLSDLFVLLHSSLSGVFNKAMVEKVGANQFIAKYDPNILTQTVVDRMKSIEVAYEMTDAIDAVC